MQSQESLKGVKLIARAALVELFHVLYLQVVLAPHCLTH